MSESTEQSMMAFEESMKAFYASEGLPAPNSSGNNGLFRQCSAGQYNTTMGYASFNGWKSRDAEINALREENERLKGIKQFLIDDFEKEYIGQNVYRWMLTAIDHFFEIEAAKEGDKP